MKKMRIIAAILLLSILLSVGFAHGQDGDEEKSPEEQFKDDPAAYLEDHPEFAVDNPDLYADAIANDPSLAINRQDIYAEVIAADPSVATGNTQVYSQVIASDPSVAINNPSTYSDVIAADPAVATDNQDVYLDVAGTDITVVNDNPQVFEEVMSQNNVDITLTGDLQGYDSATGQFTTDSGDTFTTQGLQNLADQGYSFEVDANGNLIIKGGTPENPVEMTFVDEPGDIDDNGDITSGSLDMDGDGQPDIKITQGPVTPTADGTLNLGPDASIAVDGDSDGTFETTVTSDNGLDFSMGGECTAGNCVDISDGTLSVSNTGEPPSNIDIDFDVEDSNGDGIINAQDGPYDTLNVNADEGLTPITITEHNLLDGIETTMTFEGEDIYTEGSLFLSSLREVNHDVEGEPTNSFTQNDDGTITCEGDCNLGDNSPTGQATGFFRFIGKAWDWVTGRATNRYCERVGEVYKSLETEQDLNKKLKTLKDKRDATIKQRNYVKKLYDECMEGKTSFMTDTCKSNAIKQATGGKVLSPRDYDNYMSQTQELIDGLGGYITSIQNTLDDQERKRKVAACETTCTGNNQYCDSEGKCVAIKHSTTEKTAEASPQEPQQQAAGGAGAGTCGNCITNCYNKINIPEECWDSKEKKIAGTEQVCNVYEKNYNLCYATNCVEIC